MRELVLTILMWNGWNGGVWLPPSPSAAVKRTSWGGRVQENRWAYSVSQWTQSSEEQTFVGQISLCTVWNVIRMPSFLSSYLISIWTWHCNAYVNNFMTKIFVLPYFLCHVNKSWSPIWCVEREREGKTHSDWTRKRKEGVHESSAEAWKTLN